MTAAKRIAEAVVVAVLSDLAARIIERLAPRSPLIFHTDTGKTDMAGSVCSALPPSHCLQHGEARCK